MTSATLTGLLLLSERNVLLIEFLLLLLGGLEGLGLAACRKLLLSARLYFVPEVRAAN